LNGERLIVCGKIAQGGNGENGKGKR